MDRAKTIEVLRGMKFMQRKEEAKRRELFEVQQKERLEGRLPHGGSDAAQRESGPTVLYVHDVHTSSYALSRRTFTVPGQDAAKSNASGASAAGGSAVVDGTVVHTSVPVDRDSAESGEGSSGDDDLDPSAPSYHSTTARTKREPSTEPEDAQARKRFYVEGGIRAPKMPKKLEAEMAHRKRQRDEAGDDAEGEEMPW